MTRKETKSRQRRAVDLLVGAKVISINTVPSRLRNEWITLRFELTNGEKVTLTVSADDEANGPGVLLGLWDLARERGI